MTALTQEEIQSIRRAAELIRNSKKTVALTGAGYSTPSGVPDFRSQGSGLWTKYLPMEVASLSVFRYEPEKFFEWLHPLASHMLSAEPNPAHLALSRLEENGYVHTIITQNIDGLHHRAGSKSVLEIHGTLNTLSCTGCFQKFSSEGLIEPYLEEGKIPICPNCKRILKPDVILFEEQLPVGTWLEAQKASKTADLMIIAGTSLEVLPSAGLPMRALENGAAIIMINKTETYIDIRAEILIRRDVAVVMPRLAEETLNG
jgi:NAD-dependent deacetylase